MDDKKRQLSDLAKYSNIGLQMLVIILAGVFAGIKIDEWLTLDFKVFTICLTIFAVFAALYHAIKDLLKKK